MTNLTPGILRLMLWGALIFLAIIVITKSFLYSSVAEIIYWCIVMAVRARENRRGA